MKLIARVFAVLAYHLSRLVPKSNRIVVFGSEGGRSFKGNPKYLYLKLRQLAELRCICIFKNKQAVEKAKKQGFESYHYLSLKGIYFQLRAKYLIHSHSITEDFLKILLGGAVSINTWHGCGPKKVWAANYSSFTYKALHEKNRVKRFFKLLLARTNQAKINYVLCTGEAFFEPYQQAFLVDKEKLLMLGQARNDVFFDAALEETDLPSFLKEKKIILYMPTFRNLTKVSTAVNANFDLQELNDFCVKNDYLFVIKKHMYDTEIYAVEEYSNILDISKQDYDPQLLLKYADILITDYSSCYADFILLNRPILFYCFDCESYLNRDRGLFFNYDQVTPGPKVQSFPELISELKKVVEGKDGYEQARKRVLNFLYAKENQGPVTDKQVAYLMENIIKF